MPLILSGTTGVSGVDGTAGTPALQGTDSNTGIVFGADTISLVEGGTAAFSVDSSANASLVGTLAMGSSFLRNRIINGGMRLDQRNAGASQTITAAAALAYTVDRWYAYCTGANVTGQQVSSTGTTDSPAQNAYRFTGAASVTAIGFGQRIEAVNCFDLAGQTATLSVNLANSVLTTVTWTAFYANTTDTFGTLASPTVTQIATGTFTVNSTLTRYTTNISIPSAATTGIQIVFTVGAQTSGTWTIGNVQLERGSAATPFERRQYGQELALCQRYYENAGTSVPSDVSLFWSGNVTSGQTYYMPCKYVMTKRTAATVTLVGTPPASNFPTTITVTSQGEIGFRVSSTANGTGTGYYGSNWNASAEL